MTFSDLADIVTIRPLTTWPGTRTPAADRRRAPFTASWRDTADILTREVDHLRHGDRLAVLELAVTDGQLRNDGWIRADARIDDPGVVLTIPTRNHGDLRYPCDTFNGAGTRWGSGSTPLSGWQANVRAVALALEALRKVDRYGVTSRGEQYAGWKTLPAGGDTDGRAPLEVLLEICDLDPTWDPAEHATSATAVVKAARRIAHPDRPTGSHDLFLAVQAAAEQLGVGR